MTGKHSEFRAWVRKNAEKIGDREEVVVECKKRFGQTRLQVLNAITEMKRRGQMSPDVLCRKVIGNSFKKRSGFINGKGILKLSVDVSEIKSEYDEEAKTTKGLEKLGSRLIRDNDFRMELGVPLERWKIVSGLDKFASCKKELKGRRFKGTYWGNAEVMKELSKAIEML